MNAVRLSPILLSRLEEEARRAYPEEACGFLLSPGTEVDAPVRPVASIEPAPNEFPGERRRRFVISADGLREAERRAASQGVVVSGFYHSHPDHPAEPSAFDRDHAWPWYAYLVTSVDPEGRCATGAFELPSDAGSFVRRALEIAPAPAEPTPGP